MSRLNWHSGFVESSFARSISSAGTPVANIAQLLPNAVLLLVWTDLVSAAWNVVSELPLGTTNVFRMVFQKQHTRFESPWWLRSGSRLEGH